MDMTAEQITGESEDDSTPEAPGRRNLVSGRPALTVGQAAVRDRLVKARIDAEPRLSQQDLADLTGLSVATIKAYESGARKVTHRTLATVAAVLELPDLHSLEEILVQGIQLQHAVPGARIVPEPRDKAWVHSMSFPAALLIPGLLWVLEANAAYERLHPGVQAGSSFLEWLVLDPRSKHVLSEDWWPETHLGVWTATQLRHHFVGQADLQALDRMSRAPEFQIMSTRPAARFYASRARLHLRDHTGQQYYYVNVHRDANPLPRSGTPALPPVLFHSLIPVETR
ncbi:helix-turn-helix domain-containing protein [Nocardia suismassiliense]|uniref:helix-turn-helix domain-containing protein n=1 Tax=Nocardia suismassiliense TaxID=2077092 RepID=UPI000D1DE878|nr:helix-turn-helix transcriptional regulator [Nocardia suismassiliense]